MHVTRGFYVHYKGPVYFVQGVAMDGDTHDPGSALVVYESTQGCGDAYGLYADGSTITGDPGHQGPRTRTVAQFVERVNPMTGESAPDGIPRFQRVVGWDNGVPLVRSERPGCVQRFEQFYRN